jgi:CelD/BcsL family acetyltransferase involved in cellulose biosynthesis
MIEWTGDTALADCAPWLDELHGASRLSILSRRRALAAWLSSFPEWQPWVLAVGAGDQPQALAPLARRSTAWGIEVMSIGGAAFNETPLMARGEVGAAELAICLRQSLGRMGAPWTLRLPQLPVDSPLSSAFAEQFRLSRVYAGSARPVLQLEGDRPGRRWLTPNTASALSKARNRLRREGHRLDIDWLERCEQIEEVLPALRAVHRARDLELRGRSLLDDTGEGGFYDEMLRLHAGGWRLITVRIDGGLAGYALCLLDGSTLRVWDNRVSPEWRRYSAGLIANAEVVLRAAEDSAIAAVDWGCGTQRYKTSMSNLVVDAITMTAWSSVLLRGALACRRRLIGRVTAASAAA